MSTISSFIKAFVVLLLMLNVVFVGGFLGMMGAMLLVTLLPVSAMSDQSALHFYAVAVIGGWIAAACCIPRIHSRFYR